MGIEQPRILQSKDARVGGVRWLVLALVFVAYAVTYADRANIGIALPYIKKEFHLSNTETGLLISLFSIAYAVVLVPSSFLIRKFGVRKVMPACMIACSVITGVIGAVGSALALKLCRLVLGAAEAPLGVSMMTTINNWFPPREKGTAAGVFLAASKFGPVMVPPLGALIILTLGWRWIFFLFALPGVGLAVLWYLTVPDNPAKSRFVSEGEVAYIEDKSAVVLHKAPGSASAQIRPSSQTSMGWLDKIIRTRAVTAIGSSKGIFASWDIWGAAAGYLFIQGIVGVILGWLPTYLVEVKKFTILSVGFVSAAPFAGAVLGNFLGGWMSDRLFDKRRKPTMLITCAATSCTMYTLMYAPNNPVLLSIMLFVTGVLLSIGYSAYAIYPSRMTTKEVFPLATAIVNTGGQIGGAVVPLVTGVILDRYSWNVVFACLAIGAAISLALLFAIIEPIESGSIIQNEAPKPS